MSKLYAVEIKYAAIVKADNFEDARAVMHECSDEIVRDLFIAEEDVVAEIDTEEKAKRYGYEPDCLVYHLDSGTEDVMVKDVLEEK